MEIVLNAKLVSANKTENVLLELSSKNIVLKALTDLNPEEAETLVQRKAMALVQGPIQEAKDLASLDKEIQDIVKKKIQAD